MDRRVEEVVENQDRRREIFDTFAYELFMVYRQRLPLSKIKLFLRKFLSRVQLSLEVEDPLEVCKAIYDLRLQEEYIQRLIFDQLVFGLCATLNFEYSTECLRDFTRKQMSEGLVLPDALDSDEAAKIVMELRGQYLSLNN